MYLAFTNFINLDKKKNIIYLGDWCLEDNNLKKKNYIVHKYHWDNIEDAHNDNKYLYTVYIKFISQLPRAFNKNFDKKFSNKFWEILIGEWLWNFIAIYFDRYQSLKTCIDKYKIKETTVFKNIYLPINYLEFYSLLQYDEFNHGIFSQLFFLINKDYEIKYNILDNKYENLSKLQLGERRPIKLKKKNLILIVKIIYNKIKQFIASRKNIFYNINIPIGYLSKQLIKEIGDIFYQFYGNIRSSYPNNINEDIRKNLIKFEFKFDDEFEYIVSKIIFECCPKEYIEHFDHNLDFFLEKIPKKLPKVVGIRGPNEFSNEIRYLTAIFSEKGSKILACQEGGDGGARTISHENEKINSRLCDYFLTWGWTSNNKNFISFYFTKLFWITKYKYNQNGKVVLVAGSCRRYFISMMSGQLPFYNVIMLKFNKLLLKNIENKIFNNTIYRFHHQYGFNEISKIQSEFPNLQISTRETESHFYRLMYESRLTVVTVDFTSYKQCFVLNHPTILLWDNKYFTTRDSAKVYYDKLHEAGILFFSPEECAKKINKIYDNPMKWWMSEEVQHAKNYFMNYFIRYDKDIIFKLSKIIKRIANIT